MHMTSDLSTVVPGTYFACVYDINWFLGNAIETSEENQGIKVNFTTRLVSSNAFNWPQREDICWVPVTHFV